MKVAIAKTKSAEKVKSNTGPKLIARFCGDLRRNAVKCGYLR